MYDSVDNIELAHFHREYYEKYLDIEDIPHITIIRNPIDRFISASIYLTRMYGDCQDQLEDQYYFYSMLENFTLQESINWFRPQQDFISNITHIWRFENGFKKDFNCWLSDITGVKTIKIDRKVTYDTSPLDRENKLKRTPALTENIRELYKKEIDQYYPELNNRKNIYPVVRKDFP